MKIKLVKSKFKEYLIAILIEFLFFVPMAILANFSFSNALFYLIPATLIYGVQQCISIEK